MSKKVRTSKELGKQQQMAENKTISKNACISSNHMTKGPLPNRVGTIFVVEDINAQQAEELKSRPKKYNQRLLEPSFKPLSQLFCLVNGYLLIVLVACVVWSFPVSVIPMTNTIVYPWYWWEMIVNGTAFLCALNVTGDTMMDIQIIFNFQFSRLLKPFIWSFALQFLATAGPWCLCYLVWTALLENSHPMPFLVTYVTFVGGSHITRQFGSCFQTK